MRAINSIITGPYLQGLKQYGFTGPVSVRKPILNTGTPNIVYPAPGPNVNQSIATQTAVYNLVDSLRNSNAMGDVSSNHNLIVMVFLDSTTPFPQSFGPTGALLNTIFGAHAKYEVSRILQPAIRFSYGFVCTLPGQGLNALDQATWTFSHEFAEAITNPFIGSGWVQTRPPPLNGAGEIGDMCNSNACVVDGTVVQPYWGVQQANCVLFTEARRVFLTDVQTKHVSQDGPTQTAYVDLGPICAKGNFDYVERTWDNTITVTANTPGYLAPVFTWTVNGTPVPAGSSTAVVPATWNKPERVDNLGVIQRPPGGGVPVVQSLVPGTLAGSGAAVAAVAPAPMVAHTAAGPIIHTPVIEPLFHPPFTPVNELSDVEQLIAAANQPYTHNPNATLRINASNATLTIECGPAMGNCSFSVSCQVVESWDTLAAHPGTTVTTQNSANVGLAMANQEIVWGEAYQTALKNCQQAEDAAAGRVPTTTLPQNPGDPGPEGIAGQIARQTPQIG